MTVSFCSYARFQPSAPQSHILVGESSKCMRKRRKLVRCLTQGGAFLLTFPSYRPELWHIFHDELDLDGNGHLDPKELHSALSKAGMGLLIFHAFALIRITGIELSPSTASEFIMSLSAEPHSSQISFGDFRDFFILLSRKISPAEIYQYYEVKKYMDGGCGPAHIKVKGIRFILLI